MSDLSRYYDQSYPPSLWIPEPPPEIPFEQESESEAVWIKVPDESDRSEVVEPEEESE